MGNEPRYLVYKSFNGAVHTEIQYGGYNNTVEKRLFTELARFKIEVETNNIDELKGIYKYEAPNVNS